MKGFADSIAGKAMSRRDFLKLAGAGVAGGMAVIVVSNRLKWLAQDEAYAAAQTLDFTISDAIKQMHTHNSTNSAECYFWLYKSNIPNYLPEVPGPNIIAAHGDTINISVTNSLDEDHAFYIPGIVDSGPIAPGATWQGVIDLGPATPGAYLYYDNLNEPVNRMMGLHGALIVMPVEADRTPGHNLTPYGGLPASHGVQKLYDSFGRNLGLTPAGPMSEHFPGLAWEEGDSSEWAYNNADEAGNIIESSPYAHVHAADGQQLKVHNSNTPPMRQYIWLLHQASPRLFAEVGKLAPGQLYNPQEFMDKFLRGAFALHNNSNSHSTGIDAVSYIPQYFTVNGQSGYFSHFNTHVTMIGRVGEPCLVHILNAGLWTHSMHLHANHMWITSVNGEVNPNPIWVDVYRVDPLDRIDYTVPFMRPPDVGHPKGIGLPETPLTTVSNPRIPGSEQIDDRITESVPHPVWPPVEEFQSYLPRFGTKGSAPSGDPLGRTEVELGQRMSPMCYPMHDHSEPSQTSQGGNYNTGLIAGIYFTGDRNGMMDFPMDEDFYMAFQNMRGLHNGTERAAPPIGDNMPYV